MLYLKVFLKNEYKNTGEKTHEYYCMMKLSTGGIKLLHKMGVLSKVLA